MNKLKNDEYGILVRDFVNKVYAGDARGVYEYLSSENRCYILGIACGIISQISEGTGGIVPSKTLIKTQIVGDGVQHKVWEQGMQNVTNLCCVASKQEWVEGLPERLVIAPAEFLDDGRIRVKVSKQVERDGVILLQPEKVTEIYLVPDIAHNRWLVDFWGLWGL